MAKSYLYRKTGLITDKVIRLLDETSILYVKEEELVLSPNFVYIT